MTQHADEFSTDNPQRFKRSRNHKNPPGIIWVTRWRKDNPGPWGNPYPVKDEHGKIIRTPQEAVDLFEADLLAGRGRKTVADAKRELPRRNLGCWCDVWDKDGNRVPCHADVLLRIANEP